MNSHPIHRVVTGHDADGKAIVASHGPLPTVVEIARRSPNDHELTLKREGDDGKREELYLRKSELLGKLGIRSAGTTTTWLALIAARTTPTMAAMTGRLHLEKGDLFALIPHAKAAAELLAAAAD